MLFREHSWAALSGGGFVHSVCTCGAVAGLPKWQRGGFVLEEGMPALGPGRMKTAVAHRTGQNS